MRNTLLRNYFFFASLYECLVFLRLNQNFCKCRFDARGRSAGKELHWSEERSLGPRAYFVTQSRPASLQLDNVQLHDEDTYRCRVDYRNAPTRNFRIHLTVIGTDIKFMCFILFLMVGTVLLHHPRNRSRLQ